MSNTTYHQVTQSDYEQAMKTLIKMYPERLTSNKEIDAMAINIAKERITDINEDKFGAQGRGPDAEDFE